MFARHLLAWLGLIPIACLNGTLRQFTYRKVMPELRASIIHIRGDRVLHRVCLDHDGREAVMIGLLWAVLTVAFAFSFGQFVAGHSGARNVAAGRRWIAVPLSLAVLPLAGHVFRR